MSIISGSLSQQRGAFSGSGGRNGAQIWGVGANILNKQSQTFDKRWFFSLGIGRGAKQFLS